MSGNCLRNTFFDCLTFEPTQTITVSPVDTPTFLKAIGRRAGFKYRPGLIHVRVEMNKLQVTVDAQGNTVIAHNTPIVEHCRSRARLLTSLVNMVSAQGALANFTEEMKHDMLSLMQSVANEQIPLIDALEHHTAQSFYDKGMHAALEHRQQQEQIAIEQAQAHTDYSQQHGR
jgi:hypothetical protein